MAVSSDSSSFTNYLNNFSQFYSQLDEVAPIVKKDMEDEIFVTKITVPINLILGGTIVLISLLVIIKIIPSTHHTFNLAIAGIVYGVVCTPLYQAIVILSSKSSIKQTASLHKVREVSTSKVSTPLERITDKSLPDELWHVIFSYISLPDLLKKASVCKKWKAKFYDKNTWGEYMKNPQLNGHVKKLFEGNPENFIFKFHYHALHKSQIQHSLGGGLSRSEEKLKKLKKTFNQMYTTDS